MSKESEEFDFSFGSEDEAPDPFADEDVDERGDEVSTPDLPPDPEKMKDAPKTPSASELPAEQRIERLFERLATRRRVLLGMLRFLQEPHNPTELNELVDELQKHDYSMFKGNNYADLLEEAGAIERLNEDGTPFDTGFEQIPDIIEVDGVEYLKPVRGRRILWQNTPEGQAYLDADRPEDRMRDLFAEDTPYLHIYRQILALCAGEDGTTMAAITPIADDDPITVKPRLYAPHFVDMLEKCEAIRWDGRWRITELGRKGLALLADAAKEEE